MISESQQEPAIVTTGVTGIQSVTLNQQTNNLLGRHSGASLSYKVKS